VIKEKNVYFVILCGGSGTRLWPLSTSRRPKQLIPFLNNKSLLEQTIDRISTIALNKDRIGIVTKKSQFDLIPKEITNKIGFTIQEPVGRNTGPAVLLGALEIEKKDPDAITIFLSSDAFIPEEKKYCDYLETAIEYAQENKKIITLGLMPTHPATGYGYIQAEHQLGAEHLLGADTQSRVKAGTLYKIKKFHEKPTKENATKYLFQGDMFWNLGMFVGKTKTFLQEYETHAPDLFEKVSKYFETNKNYDQAPSISIDYAVMEKSKNTAVVPCDFIWNDVGNLDVFISIQQQYDTSTIPRIINIESKNNIAKTNNKTVSFIGVENLCVVEEDGVIIVSSRNKVEKVKDAIDSFEGET